MARLHVWEWGPADGEQLVCVHGVSGHGGSFAPYARRLPSRRVLAPDLRGGVDRTLAAEAILDLRVVDGTHAIFWTALDEIAAAIDAFLHGTPASSASA